MDVVSSCKVKLAHFRVKELKDVLTQAGLAKQGKKQDLLNRILSLVSDEHLANTHESSRINPTGKKSVANIIDKIYRNLRINVTNNTASKGHSGSETSSWNHKEKHDESSQVDMKVRCPCGSSLVTESMIQCEDLQCQVWQHISCVIIPETLVEGIPPVPPHFYCEICRLNRADPFWVTVAQPLLPQKLISSDFPPDGSNPMQTLEKTFNLTRADRHMLKVTEYDVQVWCILLNDKVPFRMQWPQYAELKVNDVLIQTTGRPGSQLLGINGRDDGPVIKNCIKEGLNKITFSGCDARIFCLGVRIGKRRTIQQILNMIPKEQDGERIEDAIARVCRCIGGGNTTGDADSDTELEVVADSVTVNLRCPLSASRMKIAGRFKPCVHMGCFDLETFIELNERSRKWQCPICLKNYSLESVIVDPYFNPITTMMRDCGEDVNEIEVKPDGSWRARNERQRRDLAQWHFPDGSVSAAMDELEKMRPVVENPEEIKLDGVCEGHPAEGIDVMKRNREWQVNKLEDVHSLSSGSRLVEQYENHCMNGIPMSSSATLSCREGEDPSVNQDGGGHFDFSTNNGHETDSLFHNINPTGVGNKLPSASGNPAVIILSDSDDDDGNLVSPVIYESGQANAGSIPFSAPAAVIHAPYPDDSDQGMSRNLHPDVVRDNIVGLGMPPFVIPSDTRGNSGLQLFGNQVPGSVCRPNIDLNKVHDPLECFGDDPMSQDLFPSCPAGATVKTDLRNPLPSGMPTKDWFSLRLPGTNGVSGHEVPPVTNDVISSPQIASLADTATARNSNRTPLRRQNFDDAFSVSRQPRSVRPRLYFSVDSDSD